VGIGCRKEKDMQNTRSRKLKALVAALAAAALMAPATRAAQVDARHQALLDKAPQVQVDPRHKALLMHRHAGELNISTPATTTSEASDWGEAGIAAGVLFGVALISAGGALLGRRKLASA
jgi:UDP-3-O-[3-hydroxymyristoyl] glucosamine N-acyltransferase